MPPSRQGLVGAGPDGDAAHPRLWIQAGFDVDAERIDEPLRQRQVHPADEGTMLLDEGVERAVGEPDLARSVSCGS